LPRAEQLTSIFENDTAELQYAYTEDLHDGRGITARRAGFTTRDGDALKVVEIYSKKVPQNNLAKFLPELKRLKAKNSGDTSHLGGMRMSGRKPHTIRPSGRLRIRFLISSTTNRPPSTQTKLD
jgi:Glycosyl hydrolase family 46